MLPPAAEDSSLLLHTVLLGELRVPGAPGPSHELQALAARTITHASRPGGDTRRV